MRAVPAVLCTAVLCTAAPARAEERRYNWELAVVDAAAFAAMLGGASMENDPGAALVIIGGATYLLGAPIVHANHGNDGRAAGSLAGRLLVPFAGALAGAAIGHEEGGETSVLEGAAYGFAGGMVVTAAIDIASPATYQVDDDHAGAWLAPTAGGGFIAGVGGRF